MSKLVAVFGATGAQGGSVARALLKNPSKWKVVAVTRDVNSEGAKQLKASGAEVRACDFTKLDEVSSAIKGAYAVFGMTQFFGGYDNEVLQGVNIIEASKQAGVQHLVMSTLESVKKLTGGKREVLHFDSKAHVEEILEKSGVPYTSVQLACYYENLNMFLRPNQEGQLEISLPIPGNIKFPNFSVAETGEVVSEVLNQREKYLGKKIALTGDLISFDEITTAVSEKLGKPVKYNYIPEEIYAKLPFPLAHEMAAMFGFYIDYGVYGEKVKDIWEGKAIAPQLSTYAQWLKNWKPSV